ncbi:MAG TPA: hypothetical protein VJR26_01715 [Candidatus Acidoferrales bacterium]|nr:hypothetical protein [Candidatus Acidoferrales bacterium]
MRAFAASVIALCLAAMPAVAAGRPGDKKNAVADNSGTAAGDPAARPAVKPASNAVANPQPAPPAKPAGAEMETELQQLRDALAAQALQLKAQQQRMEQLEDQLKLSTSNARNLSVSPPPPVSAAATAPASANAATVSSSASHSVPTTAGSSTASSATAALNAQAGDEPLSWRFKGVTFSPGGFFAAETVWRQRALSADVNTPFNSLPLPGASPYSSSEFNASARQSRIAMLVQGKLRDVSLGGYYEADFLSAGITSNDNQSNSYTFRQRQFWGQAAFNDGITITGGQMWSLVTQTAKGLDNRTEVLPETVDSQYSVGFSWARQYGMRFVKNFDNKVWLGLAVEEPQTTLKSGGSTTPFLLGQAGAGGGLYNPTANYSFNLTPDFIVKAAFEPGFGHYELFGLVSTFRDRIFPVGAAPYNDRTYGGGGGANAWFPFDNGKINIGFHALVGDGVGRYGSAQSAPDVTVRPDGTFVPVRSYQGLGTLAFHYPKWDVYFHLGDEYGNRTQYISGTSTIPNVGFGAIGFNNAGCWDEPTPGSGGYAPGVLANCSNNIKNIIEGTAGVWYNFYSGPRGIMKFGVQYSHEAYNTWQGLGSTGVCASTAHPSCSPSTNENMFFTSLRYYIP